MKIIKKLKKNVIKSNQLRPITRFIKRNYLHHVKPSIVKIFRLFPFVSLSMVKGYYITSQDYFDTFKKKEIKDVIYKQFLPAQTSRKSQPKCIDKNIHDNFKQNIISTNPETFVISVDDGRVLSESAFIIASDDKLLFDVSTDFGINEKNINLHTAINQIYFPESKFINGTITVLATAGGDGYFHWITDCLPRIEILWKTLSEEEYNQIDKFIVNKKSPVVLESLKMLGIKKEKLIFLDSNTHLICNKLIVPSLPHITGNTSQWSCEFLRKQFLGNQKDCYISKKIYISRAKARYRQIINEEEVTEFLQNKGFTKIYLEEYTFAEQIGLLANAEVIVAPHGAGLTNLIWCNQNTKVLEIFSPNYVNICFWTIANQVYLDYFYLIGKEVKNSPSSRFGSHVFDDVFVSINDLKLILNMMLNNI